MRNMLFLHHIHAHVCKFLLKYEWFLNLHLYFWFYYWAPASNFKFLSEYLHIDNTLISQLIHLPVNPTKHTSSHLASWLMASLSHWLLKTTTCILFFYHTIHPFIMPPRKILGLSFLQYSKYPLYPHCASSVSHFLSMVTVTWILLAPN